MSAVQSREEEDGEDDSSDEDLLDDDEDADPGCASVLQLCVVRRRGVRVCGRERTKRKSLTEEDRDALKFVNLERKVGKKL